LDESETDEKSARKKNPLCQMRGGGKTLRRRGSIWSVGSERDDEKRERDEAWMNRETDEKSARKENLRFPVRGQVRTKRRCGDEAQSGSLVGKETTKKRER
jgi:hypothetical protein